MYTKKILVAVFLVGIAIVVAAPVSRLDAHPAPRAAVVPPVVSRTAIGGIVTSAKGPEAGVWVIAETADTPTKFVKIVTDDQGRYVLPELPSGNYKVWVRGYGLVDSKPVQTSPGKTVNLTALVAPSARAAAQYYPAEYWYSLLQVPPKSAFPMEKEGIQTQLQWIADMKGAIQFTQLGDKATRSVPESLGKFASSKEAWQAWTESGESPVNVRRMGASGIAMYADWTDRIAAGEVPPAPPRPEGVERNVVISLWDWGNDKSFIHDVTVSDTRHPSVNAHGVAYGLEQFSADKMDILDPAENSWSDIMVPMRDHDMNQNYVDFNSGVKGKPSAPLEWGNLNVRPAVMRLHNSALDQDGRLWLTGKFRKGANQPDYCKDGSSVPSAKYYPLNSFGGEFGLEAEVYDPKTKKFDMVDTCYATMHLAFADDADNTVWFSGGSQVVGFLNTKVYEETHDAAKSQGWCPYILDTNGNGKVDEYVGPDDKLDPTKDKRIRGGSYGIAVNPVDNTIWEGSAGYPGFILRINPGSNPPYTCMTEIYNSPAGTTNPKGVWVDRGTGLVWVAFAGSGTFGSFDRRKCKVLNGPTATGDHCPEGWTLYPAPGPKFKNVTDPINADWHYLNWVDQFNTLGLGKNVPLAPGTNSDSMIALLPDTKKFVVMRVPYPMGFFSRGMDGRIDDPNTGWKGRGLWTTYASISPWNVEGGKGAVPKVVKFQVRPDPLAN